jgi:hypothetical protein
LSIFSLIEIFVSIRQRGTTNPSMAKLKNTGIGKTQKFYMFISAK